MQPQNTTLPTRRQPATADQLIAMMLYGSVEEYRQHQRRQRRRRKQQDAKHQAH